MRSEIISAFTYITNINYYLNPDFIFPPEIVKIYSYMEIKRKGKKIVDEIKSYGLRAYNELQKII